MVTMALPWWLRSRPKVDMPSYSSVKQEDGGDSESGSDTPIPSRKTRQQKKFIMSIFINVGLLVLVVVMYSAQWPTWKPKKMVPSPVPDFPYEVRTFKLDPLFLSLPTEESNEAWEALSGPNRRAFIHLSEEDKKYNYPDDIAGLSMFHQLHCLTALRTFVWDLVYGKIDTEEMIREWPQTVTKPTYHVATAGLWHIAHCFDYLRQAIQCAGDTSLEFVPNDSPRAIVDGLDWPHECKSWDAIWDYAVQYG